MCSTTWKQEAWCLFRSRSLPFVSLWECPSNRQTQTHRRTDLCYQDGEKLRMFVITTEYFRKLWKSGSWFSCPMIIWRDSAVEDSHFPILLFVSVAFEEMMQALKLIEIHPRRYRSQGAGFLLELLHMDPTSQANLHMDPGQGLHLLEGAAEISCSQRKGTSSKHTLPGSGRERHCSALHSNYFSNYIELLSEKMSCHGSGLCVSWTGSGK